MGMHGNIYSLAHLHLLLFHKLHLSYIPGDIPSYREGNGTPLQYSCLENPMGGGAWWAAVHGVAKSQRRPSDFPFTFHFHALEKEMATDSSVLAWRIPGAGEPGGLPSMGSHRVGHDWWDLAAAAYLVNSISHPEEGSCSLGCWGQTFFVGREAELSQCQAWEQGQGEVISHLTLCGHSLLSISQGLETWGSSTYALASSPPGPSKPGHV